MVKHKSWQFYIFRFTADDGKHTVSVGAVDQEEGIALITDMYSNVRNIRIFPQGEEL